MAQTPEIYFHVGMGKTGTKYIQYRVFPKLKNIKYIQRTSYGKAKEIIARGEYPRYLISNEFDQQMEKEVKFWATDYPDIAPIIVFRRQDSWIASQYRRFVKNSYPFTFKEFLDLENDKGYFKKKDLEFYKNIELLEKSFTRKPLVLLYEELKNKPKKFTHRIAEFTDTKIDVESVSLSRKHTSYDLKQLKIVQSIGRRIDLRKRRITNNPILHRLFLISLSTIRYPILYISKIIPNAWVDLSPLITKKEMDTVKEYYKDDWDKVIAYAKKNNTNL